MVFVYVLAMIEAMVLATAGCLYWRARKISSWAIPFRAAHTELLIAWGIALLYCGVIGGIAGVLGLSENRFYGTFVGVSGWIVAYLTLRRRLPKRAATMNAVVDGPQLSKIENQTFVYACLGLMGLAIAATVLIRIPGGS
jgi:hypothetical protein